MQLTHTKPREDLNAVKSQAPKRTAVQVMLALHLAHQKSPIKTLRVKK